jgi:hypothetical protein
MIEWLLLVTLVVLLAGCLAECTDDAADEGRVAAPTSSQSAPAVILPQPSVPSFAARESAPQTRRSGSDNCRAHCRANWTSTPRRRHTAYTGCRPRPRGRPNCPQP